MTGIEKQDRTLPDLKTIFLDELQFYTRDNPELLDLIQSSSVLRWFDSEVIAQLLPPERVAKAHDLVEQIKKMSFCEEHSVRGVALSSSLCDLLLAQEDLSNRRPALHQSAAAAYHKLLQAKDLKPEQWFDEGALDWKILAAEWLYHLAWIDPDEAWHQLMLIFARAYAVIVVGRVEVAFSYDLLNRIDFEQVQWPEISPYPKRLKELNRKIQVLLANQDKNALDFLEELAQTPGLTDAEIASLYQWIGSTCFREADLRSRARERLETAHRLDPTDLLILTELAAYHSSMGIYWGRLDLSRQYAEEAVRLKPDSSSGYLELGDLCQMQSDWDTAITWYQKAREVNPQSIDAPLGLSDVYAARHRSASESTPGERDDLALALQWIDSAEMMSMGIHYFALIRRGIAYQSYLKFDEAGQVYEMAVQEDPERPEAYLGKGKLATELGQHRKAIAYFKTAREKGSSPDADLSIAQLLEQQGKLEQAAAVCRQALQEGGKSLVLYRKLHDLYSLQGRWEQMESVWQAWLNEDPGSEYLALCLMGDAYQNWAWKQRSEEEMNSFSQRAENIYKRALEIDPSLAWAHAGLAELALLRDDASILAEHRQVIETQAPWALYDTLVQLGLAYLNKADFDHAQELLTAATQLSAHRPEAWLALVDVYEAQDDEDRLLQTWAKLEKQDATYNPLARLRIGDYYRSLFDYERARQQYEQAALLPNPVEAKLRLADLSREEGNWSAAQEGYRWILENAPIYEAFAHAEISAIFLENRVYDDAETSARKAIVSDPQNVSGYISLAKLAVQRENPDLLQEARGRLKNACPERLADLEYAIAESFRSLAEDSRGEAGDVKAGRKIQRSFRQAKQAYMQAIQENEQRGRDYPEADLGLALVLVQQKKYKEAQRHFQHAIDLFSPQEDFNAYLKFGEAFEKIDDNTRAEQNYRLAIKTSGVHPFGHLYLASVLRKEGKSDEALREYELARETGGVSCLLLGRYYESQDRMEDALACYQLGKEKSSPEELPALFLASAMIHYDQKNLNQVEADLKRSIQLAPDLDNCLVLVGFLLLDKDQPEQAEQVLRQTMEKPELAYDAQVGYARLLIEKGRLDQAAGENWLDRAQEEFRKAIRTEPEQITAYQELGVLLEEQQLWDKALQIYQEMSAHPSMTYQAHISAGRVLTNQNKFPEAEKAFQQANVLEPQNASGYWGLAELRREQGKIAEAIDLYQQIIAIATDPLDLSLAYTYLGEQYIEAGQFDEAITALEQALQQNPANELASYNLGYALEKVGQDEAAARMYTRAVDINPKYGDAYIGLGSVYGKLKQPEKVVELAQRLRRMVLPPDEVYEARRVIALTYTEAGEYHRALAPCREMIRLNPENQDAYKLLAGLLLELDESTQALEVLEQMAEQPALRYEAGLLLGDLQSKLEHLEEAEAAYREMVRLDPEMPDAYFSLTDLLERNDKPDQAAEVYAQMAEQPALRYDASLLLGDLQFDLGHLEEAEAAYRQALEVDLDQPEAYIRLAVLLLDQERQKEVHQLLQQMVDRPELAAAGYFSLGIVLQQEGNLPEAENAFREAALRAPDDPAPYLYLAELYQQIYRPDAAKQALDDALRVAPDDVETNRKMAEYYLGQGSEEEAVQFYKKIVQFSPDDPQAHYDLGMLLLNLDDLEEARDALLRATEIEPKFGQAYIDLGRVYGKLGEVQGVHQIARKIDSMQLEAEEKYDAYLVIAAAYEQGNFPEWAIESLKKAITQDPARADAYQNLGWLYEQDDRWYSAIEVYEKALQASFDPQTEADLRVGIGRCYLTESQYRSGEEESHKEAQRKAQVEFQRAVKMAPEHGEASLWLGQLFEANEQWAKARGIYSRALQGEQEPDIEAGLRLGRSRCLLSEVNHLPADAEQRQKNERKAEREFRRVIKIAPTTGSAYVSLGALYETQGHWAKARKLYNQAIATGAELDAEVDFRLWLGQNYLDEAQANPDNQSLRQKNEHKAEDEFQRAVNLDPNRTDAQEWLAYLYEIQGKWSLARQVYERVLQGTLQPAEKAGYRLHIGRIYLIEARNSSAGDEFTQEMRRKAEAEFQRAITLEPSQRDGYLDLGLLYEDQGRLEEAVQTYLQLASADPSMASSAYLSLASIHRRLGKPDEQRQYSQAALDCPVDPDSPTYSDMLRRKGLAYFMLDEYDLADESLRKALAINQQDFMACFYEALTLLCLGKEVEAQAKLQDGIRMAGRPDDYRYIVEETEALAERQPELPGLNEMLQELNQARDRLQNNP